MLPRTVLHASRFSCNDITNIVPNIQVILQDRYWLIWQHAKSALDAAWSGGNRQKLWKSIFGSSP
jgi:hypothetical protein